MLGSATDLLMMFNVVTFTSQQRDVISRPSAFVQCPLEENLKIVRYEYSILVNVPSLTFLLKIEVKINQLKFVLVCLMFKSESG